MHSIHSPIWSCLAGAALFTALNQSVPAQNTPPGTIPIVVSIEATQPIAEETSAPLRRLALRGLLTLSRSGPTNDPLRVFVHYHGIATPGIDYPPLPFLVTIPAGAVSAQLEVVPVDDGIQEGIETLVATLSHCPPDTDPPLGMPCVGGFEIAPAASQATIFLRDDGITQASLTITQPKSGANFPIGAPILIEAIAIDLDSYLNRVEFYDGDKLIGVSEILFIRAPDPGTPIEHSFEWRDASPGSHVLTAQVRALGAVLRSPPVQITIGPGQDRVVLEIEATDAVATEPGSANALDPAVFTIRRIAGPVDLDVTAFYTVSGTAANGVDYAELPGRVLLPSGAQSVRLMVNPVADKALEGEETVVLRLDPPACIQIFPPPPDCYEVGSSAVARAVIREHESNQAPHAAIVRPAAGALFPIDADIEILVNTRDPDGYVRRVEFFANGRKIGESNIEFIRAPDPNQPQTFTFVWHESLPGRQVLTARATDDRGGVGASAPVEILVGDPDSLPIVIVRARDAFAVEPTAGTQLNTAAFRITRFGPTNEALVVAYSLLGMAENGTDYETLPVLATIRAAARSADVIVRPRADNLTEGLETVRLRLDPPPSSSAGVLVIHPYQVGRPGAAVAVISDRPWVPGVNNAGCGSLPGGLVHVCFGAENGANFRLEASPDLRNWESLCDTPNVDGAWHFIDADGERHPHRFYRLAPEPLEPE